MKELFENQELGEFKFLGRQIAKYISDKFEKGKGNRDIFLSFDCARFIKDKPKYSHIKMKNEIEQVIIYLKYFFPSPSPIYFFFFFLNSFKFC